ncbi:MAG: excinuclease ABC subunit UvrC [Coriobacteriia bacterium]|nr:excinuclease ABC subunit UvrC [Coriobacteriia bacterium]MCL2750367.1 excinuclease ABC subunit UvrC [Coriobacteriia bacterium]
MNEEFSHLGELKKQLEAVPTLPGVYLWKDAEGTVLYVGKAKQLRARMRQYVNFQDERATIPTLMARTRSFDYLVTASEHESLILEKNLIDQFSPKFNVGFSDDKSYPFIALTLADEFPAIKYTREKPQAGTRYFGPYTDARAAQETMDTARRIVPLCKTSCVEWKRLTKALAAGGALEEAQKIARPCFDYHVGLGPGPCVGHCTHEEYGEHVKKITRFLSGHRREFISSLKEEMTEAAEELDFERAARTKKRLETLMHLKDKQSVVLSPRLSADSIGFFREETITGVQVFSVREGVVLLRNDFILDKGRDVSDDELVRTFLLKYYEQASQIPKEILLRDKPSDSALIEDWLTEKLASARGAKVRITTPKAGEKHELLKLTEQNAKHALVRYMVRTRYLEERVNSALIELESALSLDETPMRIECYDISTFHGAYSVASLVVFEGGRPAKKEYRHFKIKLQSEESNDVAMMAEVLSRRFSTKNRENTRFAKKPDLIIVDGGKPQLNAAIKVLKEAQVEGVDLVGLAKRNEELFVTWQTQPVILPSGSMSLYLVKQVRDEAHRFAITHHRKLRSKGMTNTILNNIPGLGPTRRKALLKAFGTQKALKAASLEAIALVPGIPDNVAKNVYSALHCSDSKDEEK